MRYSKSQNIANNFSKTTEPNTSMGTRVEGTNIFPTTHVGGFRQKIFRGDDGPWRLQTWRRGRKLQQS